ncbi:WxL domain-containing protein [Vagococcus sp. BWB3-3]|uniref:WxL domain-containing protein n=1 Tax=Vagococcus allomyrinae TaxID=2794353 RepID=A0A940PCV4_9ENTE|nr:WxL domain-containing protein [Vagococcus allomyrinae]MBP1042609.1 WxL domain-containing protein [Vagococcus allomyrinae]
MKLVKLSTIALVSVIALTATAQVSQAVESTAKVKLEADTATVITPPIVPEPDTPKPDITDEKGPLSIDVAPHFQFADAKVVSGTVTYPLANTNNPYVQVTDTRGKGAGWDLKIKISEFESADKNVLKGAEMSLGFGELRTTNPAGITEAAPTTAASVTLNGAPQSILSAAKATGLGTWANFFNKATTNPTSKLVIPGGSYVGEYTATIDWTLSDTPK